MIHKKKYKLRIIEYWMVFYFFVLHTHLKVIKNDKKVEKVVDILTNKLYNIIKK